MRARITFLIVLFAVIVTVPLSGQVRLGIKGGLSTSDVPASSLLIVDEADAERFKIGVDDAKYGIHLGMFIQAQAGHFFIQPEVLFNTATIDYAIEDLQTGAPTSIRDEIYRNLDIPIILGLKFGPVRIGGGPVGHLFLDSTSDLRDFTAYKPDFDRLTFGWQAGLGLDIWKLHLDARYEGNFNYSADHFVFYGRRYHFSERPTRFLVSAGISF
jgi:hypothetical protein